jgi:hypothetical protein
MPNLENLQEELFYILSSVDFGNRYYGFYEAHFDVKSQPDVNFYQEFLETTLLATGLDFKYSEEEEVFEYVDKRDKLEINLKVTIQNSKAAFALVLKTGGRAVEWPFWGLAAEVELLRDPDFEYFPRNPRLPATDPDTLQETVNFGVVLYKQAREAIFAHVEDEKSRSSKKRFVNKAAA